MKAGEVIKVIIDAYLQKVKELNSPKEKVFEGLKKVRDVFAELPTREAIRELLFIMMQPSTEAVYYESVINSTYKNNSHRDITVNIKNGMGLPIEDDLQVAIIGYVESIECEPKRFGKAMANAVSVKLREFK